MFFAKITAPLVDVKKRGDLGISTIDDFLKINVLLCNVKIINIKTRIHFPIKDKKLPTNIQHFDRKKSIAYNFNVQAQTLFRTDNS